MRSIEHRFLRLACGVLASLLLGACAIPLDADRQLRGDEGALVVRVVTNEVEPMHPASIMTSLVIETVPASGAKPGPAATERLSRYREAAYAGAVYGGVLKPGRYRLASAEGTISPGLASLPIEYRQFLFRSFGEFEVRAGQVTTLGTLLFNPERDGRPFQLGWVPADADLQRSIERRFPAMAVQLRDKPAVVPESTPQLEQARQAAPAVRNDIVAIHDLWQGERGDHYAGSRMGRALRRPAGSSTWETLDVGTVHAVMTLRPFAGGLLAGGDEGLLAYSPDEGRSWQRLPPPEMGVVYRLEILPSGKVLAVVRRDLSFNAWISDDPRASPWRKLGTLNREQAFLDQQMLQEARLVWWPPAVVVDGTRVGFMDRSGVLRWLDMASGSFEVLQPRMLLRQLSRLDDGTLVLVGAGFGQSNFVSTDAGRSWEELWTHGVAALKTRSRALLIRGNTASVLADDGKTWTVTRRDLPWGADQLRVLVADRVDDSWRAVLLDGRILRTQDEGRSWQQER